MYYPAYVNINGSSETILDLFQRIEKKMKKHKMTKTISSATSNSYEVNGKKLFKKILKVSMGYTYDKITKSVYDGINLVFKDLCNKDCYGSYEKSISMLDLYLSRLNEEKMMSNEEFEYHVSHYNEYLETDKKRKSDYY